MSVYLSQKIITSHFRAERQGDYIYIRQLKIMFDDACALVRILDMVNPFVEGVQ